MQSRELIEWLSQQDAQMVQAWIERVWRNEQDIPNDFNWQHLTARSDIFAREGPGPEYYTEPDLGWAKVAVLLYHYLISKADPWDRIGLELS